MSTNINGDHNIVGDHNEVNVVYGDVYSGGNYGPSQGVAVSLFSLVFFVLILIALAIKFWWITLVIASVGALAIATWLEKMDREEKRQLNAKAASRKEALAKRADQQNSAYLRGELWGMYGDYPPSPEVGS